jgi:hypothetical protein
MNRTTSRDPRLNPPPVTPEREESLQRLVTKKALLDIQQAELVMQKAKLDLIQEKHEEELKHLKTELQDLARFHDQGPYPKRPPCLKDPRLYNEDFVSTMLRGKVPGYMQPTRVTRTTTKATNPTPDMTSTSVTSNIDEPLPASAITQGLNASPTVRVASMWPRAQHPIQGLNTLFEMRESTDRTGSNSPDPRKPKEGS